MLHNNIKKQLYDINQLLTSNQLSTALDTLKQILGDRFKLTREFTKDSLYESLLHVIKKYTFTEENFYYAAKHLFLLAVDEVNLGIYERECQALNLFIILFLNSCSYTKVKLVIRKNFLQECLEAADKENNYYQLHVLLRTFANAADALNNGEDDYIEDDFFESYINYAIDMLMKYTGMNDENGLCLTAEEEVHKLLKLTINEKDIAGACHVPFRIFRHYFYALEKWAADPKAHADKGWNQDPLFCIDDLEKESKENKELELRFQQLASFGNDRAFLIDDFDVFLDAKKIEKMCMIADEKDPQSRLTLHQRQSLAERLIFTGTDNIHKISNRGKPKGVTYLIVNFGMVLSDQPQKKGGLHHRVFKTIPISTPDYAVTGDDEGGHAEEALFRYLLDANNIKNILQEFKKQFGIISSNHKIYAISLDMHGTYDMCIACNKLSLIFQDKFRSKLLTILSNMEMKTLTKYPSQLPIMIRYSSDVPYHFPNSPYENKQGTCTHLNSLGNAKDLTIIDAELPKVTEKSPNNLPIPSRILDSRRRNIRDFGSNLLLHGKSNWHNFWSSEKREEKKKSAISLERWSAFANTSHFNKLEQAERKKNYTKLSMVDTAEPIQEVEDLIIGNMKLEK